MQTSSQTSAVPRMTDHARPVDPRDKLPFVVQYILSIVVSGLLCYVIISFGTDVLHGFRWNNTTIAIIVASTQALLCAVFIVWFNRWWVIALVVLGTLILANLLNFLLGDPGWTWQSTFGIPLMVVVVVWILVEGVLLPVLSRSAQNAIARIV